MDGQVDLRRREVAYLTGNTVHDRSTVEIDEELLKTISVLISARGILNISREINELCHFQPL